MSDTMDLGNIDVMADRVAQASEKGTANQFGITVGDPGYDAVANLPGWSGPEQ